MNYYCKSGHKSWVHNNLHFFSKMFLDKAYHLTTTQDVNIPKVFHVNYQHILQWEKYP